MKNKKLFYLGQKENMLRKLLCEERNPTLGNTGGANLYIPLILVILAAVCQDLVSSNDDIIVCLKKNSCLGFSQ